RVRRPRALACPPRYLPGPRWSCQRARQRTIWKEPVFALSSFSGKLSVSFLPHAGSVGLPADYRRDPSGSSGIHEPQACAPGGSVVVSLQRDNEIGLVT